MQQGEVRWYDPALGVGVIGQAGGQDLWVFAESLAEPATPLEAGERVTYYVVFGPWGPEATRVRRVAG